MFSTLSLDNIYLIDLLLQLLHLLLLAQCRSHLSSLHLLLLLLLLRYVSLLLHLLESLLLLFDHLLMHFLLLRHVLLNESIREVVSVLVDVDVVLHLRIEPGKESLLEDDFLEHVSEETSIRKILITILLNSFQVSLSHTPTDDLLMSHDLLLLLLPLICLPPLKLLSLPHLCLLHPLRLHHLSTLHIFKVFLLFTHHAQLFFLEDLHACLLESLATED